MLLECVEHVGEGVLCGVVQDLGDGFLVFLTPASMRGCLKVVFSFRRCKAP